MKTRHKIHLLSIFILLHFSVQAQNKEEAKTLVKQGVTLHDAGKYAEAIEKYKEALKIDPDNTTAQYEISYSLSASGKGQEAIPYLEKLAAKNISGESYDLLAGIYDDAKDYEKAVTYYKLGIVAFPDNQLLHYNLALSYVRQRKYEEAEQEGITAIKLNPKHASSQRVYALAAYGQHKLGESLLAWCSFLMLEPQTNRSAEANQYLQNIINYGHKKNGEKNVTISVSEKDINSPDFLLPMTVVAATTDKKDLTSMDSLTFQLRNVFLISENFAGKNGDAFYKSYFSDYFKSLAASDNMPAFTRLITVSTNQEENLKWFKENDNKLTALDTWVKMTNRKFN